MKFHCDLVLIFSLIMYSNALPTPQNESTSPYTSWPSYVGSKLFEYGRSAYNYIKQAAVSGGQTVSGMTQSMINSPTGQNLKEAGQFVYLTVLPLGNLITSGMQSTYHGILNVGNSGRDATSHALQSVGKVSSAVGTVFDGAGTYIMPVESQS